MTKLFGITERGDGGLDLSWVDILDSVSGAIIISKNINDNLISNLLKFSNKLILHATITGLGGSIIEPNVPIYQFNFVQILKLISLKFPKNQIVIRIDPIFPGLIVDKIEPILKFCVQNGIFRVRFSFIDMYKHVIDRFKQYAINYPNFPIFNLDQEKEKYFKLFNKYTILNFESCTEYIPDDFKFNIKQIGCISKLDYDILKLEFHQYNNFKQRPNCLCINKKELLNNKKRCPHQCLYCYWKD